jgi:indolepyruvate ferredoxin oxidoreductase alpha subunit
MSSSPRLLLSGNEAIALAARNAGVGLGCGYPGTPSTEILERFSELGGKAQWSPNEKVALEVGLGAAYAGAAAIVTMKHVGLNVAADPLFTAAYTGVNGALVLVCADDPGMASSQNEQDNRRYAVAAGVIMLEPSDSQEAYDFTLAALSISHGRRLPVMLRVTTRVCHSKTIVNPAKPDMKWKAEFQRDIARLVMIPSNARKAHRRLRQSLNEVAAWNEQSDLNVVFDRGRELGVIASGIAFQHVMEAAPDASVLKLGMTHPLPMQRIRNFAESFKRCVVIEEGDPYLADAIRSAGIQVESKSEMYRFGELNVERVRRILANDVSPEAAPLPGKPPQLCVGCPHRVTFEALRDLGCIVAGDIGCYTLGVLPPFEAMDTCVCMGASITVALGMRQCLPPEQARKVVSVIGDSTFVHSGLTGLVEMVYNPPASGHVVVILDNGTTAMTGLQEHAGTGRTLDHKPANRVVFEDVARAMGISNIRVVDPLKDAAGVSAAISESLASGELCLVIVRRPCLLAAKRIKQYEAALKDGK